tara:strand:- start:33 stop:350 length:318 start_codon:yes stop_codon:yes gene_type:complete
MNKNQIIPTLGGRLSQTRKEPQSQYGVEQYLQKLAEVRQQKEIKLENVIESLNFSRSTLEALEEGNLEFITYPLNYFFCRQYAEFLKVPFPKQFLMIHFKPKGAK